MKFIHVADIHLGAEPDAGKAYSKNRGRELWDSFEKLLQLCEEEQTDLLLIAGDLFHRQPLLRELKEVRALFSALSHTEVVLIAGNHDYVKKDSYYTTFEWGENVHMLLDEELDYVELPALKTCVYGLSYHRKMITEPLYDHAVAGRRQPIKILLAHGGDNTHIPIQKSRLMKLGYDYIALGHIHKPLELVRGLACYSGALEPIDMNDTGRHGFIEGEITRRGTTFYFKQFAYRSYIHQEIPVSQEMTATSIKERIRDIIKKNGTQNIYRITLTGYRDPEMEPDFSGMDAWGNIVEFQDHTGVYYDYEKLRRLNEQNILGQFIDALSDSPKGSVEQLALEEGIRALMETRRGEL